MKNADKLTEKKATLLAGAETLGLYLKAISWNLRSMMGQLDVLETAILEIKANKQQPEHISVEPAVPGFGV
jgi:hypothetical protein